MDNIHQPQKILIFELNWLGDILFSFPFIRALRKSFPGAYISCAVVPRYAELLAYNPWVSDIHVLSDDNDIRTLGEKLAFINIIRKEKYDTCFLLKPSSTKAMMALLSGIPTRVGFSGKKSSLTVEVDLPKEKIHRIDQLLALASAIGIKEADGAYEYFVTEEYEEKMVALLLKEGRGAHRMVVLNPGGNWGPKRWTSDNFIRLGKMLLERFEDVEIMVSGAAKDLGICQHIASGIGPERCYTLAGRTGLNDLAALFKKASLVVSGDSGPMHLASAVGAPVVALYGPTDHRLAGPRGKGLNIVIQSKIRCEVPCYAEKCDLDYECMSLITPTQVFDEAEKILS